MCMKAYPEDFTQNTGPKPHILTCQTAVGIRHVQSDFFRHIQHLGIETHHDTPVFMPEVHVSRDFVVPHPNPLKQEYL